MKEGYQWMVNYYTFQITIDTNKFDDQKLMNYLNSKADQGDMRYPI